MDVSVVIPSRNRPALLRKAIESVLMQDHDSIEVLIVNDGSDGPNEAEYRAIGNDYGDRVRVHDLEKTTTGHGQSYGINIGVELALGSYVTFLDDDDFWTDPHHVSRCHSLIERMHGKVDAIYCDQVALLSNGEPVTGGLWLQGLLDAACPRLIDPNVPAYQPTVEDLMKHPGFGHLNTSIVRRQLYLDIGGMDNNIRYECDRDFFLRTVDAASSILYLPVVVSQHNVPNQTRRDNMSTVVSDFQKALFQLYLLDKARLLARHASVREHGRSYKGVTLKRIAEILSADGRHTDAAAYAREALSIAFSFKWLGYSAWLQLRRLLN